MSKAYNPEPTPSNVEGKEDVSVEDIYKKHRLPIYDDGLKEAIINAIKEYHAAQRSFGMSIVLWNNAKIMTQEEFSKWFMIK